MTPRPLPAIGSAFALLVLISRSAPAAAEPYSGWYPLYWARWGPDAVMLWDPWPSAVEVRPLEDGETFDFPPTADPADALIDRNGYVEIVTEDGEMGWIPATTGITLRCVSR